MYDIQGRPYALVSDLKAGDQVQVDDLIEMSTKELEWSFPFLMKTDYEVYNSDYGLYIKSGQDQFFLDAQIETDPSSGVKYYIGIYSD